MISADALIALGLHGCDPGPKSRGCRDSLLSHLARRMRAGRGLIPGDPLWARAARSMRAGRGLPCPREPLGRARLAVARSALVVAPTIRACHPRHRAAADATPQLLGI